MRNKMIEIILLVCLLTVICIPSSFSVYRSESNTNGLLTAASWDVGLDQTGINSSVLATKGATNGTYTLKVVSESEVDVSYSITVSGLPSGVDVSLNNYNNGAFQTPIGGSTTFTDAGIINYTGSREEVTRTLTFRANNGATLVNNQSVTISVEFKQI